MKKHPDRRGSSGVVRSSRFLAMKGGKMQVSNISRSLYTILLLISSISVADAMDPPDIHTQTLYDYAYAAFDADIEIKLRVSSYLDSLESELERLSIEIENSLINIEGMPEVFRESHETFLQSVDLWASFAEEVQWYDPLSGETYYGSGMGYTFMHVTASLLWEKILEYRQALESICEYGMFEFQYPQDSRDIGGR
ncbi:hypothetical protein DRQ25_08340 [Candidatus Fermentibacteria bacterium]|nr:MAG: hypothetical protein DRQ25_08340 [Candidatus Fermentibacteria bacterium]